MHLPEDLPCSGSRKGSKIQAIQVRRCRVFMVFVVKNQRPHILYKPSDLLSHCEEQHLLHLLLCLSQWNQESSTDSQEVVSEARSAVIGGELSMLFLPSRLKRDHMSVRGHASSLVTLRLAITYMVAERPLTFPRILGAQSVTATRRCL